jgi:hypothetical protein
MREMMGAAKRLVNEMDFRMSCAVEMMRPEIHSAHNSSFHRGMLF